MKRLIQLALLLFGVMVVSCQDDEISNFDSIDLTSQIQASKNGVTSPQWLVNAIKDISEQHNNRNPFVILIDYKGNQYIHLADWANSCLTCGNLIYTSTGEEISYDDPLYNKLMGEKNKQIIWWEGMDFPADTRSLGSAANVYTPFGSLVPRTYYYSEDFTAADKAAYKAATLANFSHAVYMGEATTTYNCHAYAWSVTEGGPKVWMGYSPNDPSYNPTKVYWNDGSYVETTQADATKVSYPNGNHSAVTTETANWFISKWGDGPLMKHRYDDCPYVSTGLRYFKKSPKPAYYIGTSASEV